MSIPTSMPDQTAGGEGPHSRSTNDKLVYMANQIGTFFLSLDTETASAKIAEHIRKFWDPRMRRAILAHLDKGGAGLDPASRRAVESLRESATGR